MNNSNAGAPVEYLGIVTGNLSAAPGSADTEAPRHHGSDSGADASDPWARVELNSDLTLISPLKLAGTSVHPHKFLQTQRPRAGQRQLALRRLLLGALLPAPAPPPRGPGRQVLGATLLQVQLAPPTGTGVRRLVVVPSPSWPLLLSPQQ